MNRVVGAFIAYAAVRVLVLMALGRDGVPETLLVALIVGGLWILRERP